MLDPILGRPLPLWPVARAGAGCQLVVGLHYGELSVRYIQFRHQPGALRSAFSSVISAQPRSVIWPPRKRASELVARRGLEGGLLTPRPIAAELDVIDI